MSGGGVGSPVIILNIPRMYISLVRVVVFDPKDLNQYDNYGGTRMTKTKMNHSDSYSLRLLMIVIISVELMGR